MPLGHELEIVNWPYDGAIDALDGISGGSRGFGDTTGWDFARSLLGIGTTLLAIYGLSLVGKERRWW